MARREFLQLAKPYKQGKHSLAGKVISEKLDGTRCFWDGGLTRGLQTKNVPWANLIDPKTGEPKKKVKPVATGLWSRYGNPIMAPDWFLNALPCIPLDGELWAGRGNFQLCRSICAGDEPDPRFDQIEFAVYSCPPIDCVFGNGEIKNPNFHLAVNWETINAWLQKLSQRRLQDFQYLTSPSNFDGELLALREALESQNDWVYLHRQVCLPGNETEAERVLEEYYDSVLDQGGEGLIIRDPQALWIPKRTETVLKYKPDYDAEARVVGFTSGRLTDKGSKLLGMIGALICDYKGKRLELAGLTNEERQFAKPEFVEFAKTHPGHDMPDHFQGKHFKAGDVVSFKYREHSDDGIPKDARYWRRPMPERKA